jgi:excisionase family DNA binding protein
MNQDELLTVREVAAYLRISEQTIRDMLSRKELPGTKFGKAWRVRRAELEAMSKTNFEANPETIITNV